MVNLTHIIWSSSLRLVRLKIEDANALHGADSGLLPWQTLGLKMARMASTAPIRCEAKDI
jgi:hypothetical protein